MQLTQYQWESTQLVQESIYPIVLSLFSYDIVYHFISSLQNAIGCRLEAVDRHKANINVASIIVHIEDYNAK